MKKENFLLNIVFKNKYIIVYFLNKILLKQYYIKDKSKAYSLFFIYIYLYKFGLLNRIFKVNVHI
jgi:hypothetical protein